MSTDSPCDSAVETLSKDALNKHNQTLRVTSGDKQTAEPEKRSGMAGLFARKLTASEKRSEAGSSMTHSGTTASAGLRSMMFVRRKMNKWMRKDRQDDDRFFIENSYKMEPEEGTKFSPSKATEIMDSVLHYFLKEGAVYDPKKSAQMCRLIADEIKQRVKMCNFPRYKIVAYVMIGQNTGQGIEYASRSVWDMENDNMATARFTNSNLFAIATCFATYFE